MKCPKCQSDNPDDSKFCSNCATSLTGAEEAQRPVTQTIETPREELTTGSTFAGRYQIIEELGKGGMGKVYKVHDRETNEKVALKLIKPEIASDKKTIERFRNELTTARKISHRNVCRMYDLSKDKDTYYITMEYVSGEDLKNLLRRTDRLTVGKAVFIAKQICEGLTEAHKLGIVHRDLKPQNIMIDRNGEVRIMDFGIARSLHEESKTGPGIMIGTPEYMSPEQAEANVIDQRTDIYALGIILYEMLTGEVPFSGDTALSIALKHKVDSPRNPRELNPQIPEDLSQLILKCLKKDKETRCQKADGLLSELADIEQGLPSTQREIPKRKSTTSKEITVTLSPRRLLVPGLLMAAIIIVVVLIVTHLPGKKEVLPSSGKPSVAVLYFKDNTGDENLAHWRIGLSGLLIDDLSQSKFIKVLPEDQLLNILQELNLTEAEDYSSDDLKRIAEKGNIDSIVLGKYVKAGDNFRINASIKKIGTGEDFQVDYVEEKGEENFFGMIDTLTKRIKEKFSLSASQIADDIDENIGVIITSSPEALRYYSEGRKYFYGGYLRKSIDLMEKAVVIDPEFAMAYRSMATSYLSLFRHSESRIYSQKAMGLRDRLSERERYLVEGSYFDSLGGASHDKAIASFMKLLELYPDDLIGNAYLAVIYHEIEEWDRAIEKYEVCRKNRFLHVASYITFADVYLAIGNYDKAKEVLEFCRQNISDRPVVHRKLAECHILEGNLDLAAEEVDKAFTLNPNASFSINGDIYLYRNELIKAEEEYNKILEAPRKLDDPMRLGIGMAKLAQLYQLQGRFEDAKRIWMQVLGLAKVVREKTWESLTHAALAWIELELGNLEEALKECQGAWNASVEAENLGLQIDAFKGIGLILAEMGLMDKAKKTAEELKSLIEKGIFKKRMRFYYHLMGMIEKKRDNYSGAIDYFKQAISLLPCQHGVELYSDQVFFIEPLASAYYESEDFEKAVEEYKKILPLTLGRQNYSSLYAKSFYMLGKIYEQQDNKAKSLEHYEKFLTLWKDADPGLPEVADARERVATLKIQ